MTANRHASLVGSICKNYREDNSIVTQQNGIGPTLRVLKWLIGDKSLKKNLSLMKEDVGG